MPQPNEPSPKEVFEVILLVKANHGKTVKQIMKALTDEGHSEERIALTIKTILHAYPETKPE